MKRGVMVFALAGLVACAGAPKSTTREVPAVTAAAAPAPAVSPATPTVVDVTAGPVNYARHYGKGGEVIEVPLDFTDDTTPTEVTLTGPAVKVVMSAEGVCGRTMDRICAMYEGCTIDRPGYVRRVALGHHDAVYELEVTFDARPEAARVVQHALASWKVPEQDGAWFCHR